MTFYHGTAARFYWHTFDMSGYVEQVEQQLARDLAEYKPLNAAGVQRVAGRRTARLALTGGALDPAAGANDVYAWNRLDSDTTPRPWAFLPYGDAHGRVAYCGQSWGENQQRVAGDDVIRLPVALLSTAGIDRCVILRALSAGGVSPSASYDGTVGSAAGGAAYLLCTALGAGATLTVTFQHSTNNVDWVDLVTMTALSTAGSEVTGVAGAVSRYLRVGWTLVGGTPTATWFAAFGRR